MSLKQNYKNDKFVGKRKYKMTTLPDGDVSLDDTTVYEEIGDILSADDINNITKVVNSIDLDSTDFKTTTTKKINELSEMASSMIGGVLLELPVTGWTTTAPYTQTIPYAGLKVAMSPIYGLLHKSPYSDISMDAENLAWSYIDRAESGNGSVTFYCYRKRPVANVNLLAKGVGANV